MKRLSLSLLVFCAACAQESKLETLAKMPKELSENSACEVIGDKIWTTEDHGNKNVVYQIGLDGKMAHKTLVLGVVNNDWEELTSDDAGNLYIGDFGNNDNDRKNLAIYRIDAQNLMQNEARVSAKTTFHYPEQTEFPPKKSKRFFDCEAFFVKDGFFYLFTKNRSSNFDGTTSLYKIPNKPGDFAARKLGEFQTCGIFSRCAITAADISPNGKIVALLTGDKVFLFTGFASDNFFSGKSERIELDHFSQKEGLGFLSDDEILISDEKTKKVGGHLYKLRLSEAKP